MIRRVLGLVLVVTVAGAIGLIAARVADAPTPPTTTVSLSGIPPGDPGSDEESGSPAGTNSTTEDESASSSSLDVGGVLAVHTGGKLVALVSGATELRREVLADGDAVRRYLQVTVDEVLLVVDREGAPNAASWRTIDFPPVVGVGDHLILRETYLTHSQEGFDYDLPPGPLLVSLVYAAQIQEPGNDPVFGVTFAATVSPDGSLTNLHRRYGPSLDEQLTRFESYLDWQGTSAELITAWTAETWLNVDTDVVGPISQAFKDSVPRPPTALEIWNATDPRNRSLIPGDVPPEIREGLIEIEALVDLVGEARPSDRHLIIRTNLGIIHAAQIPAGSHPATFLAPPGSTWEVYIAFDENGMTETLVARIRPEEWTTATNGSHVLIRLDEATISTPTPIDGDDDPSGLVSIVDAAESADILMSWVNE
jgi:hypothetical protein